ncbi:MAG TPA: hypothetical protein DCP20_01060 [Coriobacteriia bacterium]|nr:hypothetical protein [Coriobacteriia bacterium]
MELKPSHEMRILMVATYVVAFLVGGGVVGFRCWLTGWVSTEFVLNVAGITLGAMAIPLTVWQRLALRAEAELNQLSKWLSAGSAIFFALAGAAAFSIAFNGLGLGITAVGLGLTYIGFALTYFYFAVDIHNCLARKSVTAGASATASATTVGARNSTPT